MIIKTLYITNEGRKDHFYIFNFSVVRSSVKHDFARQLFVDNPPTLDIKACALKLTLLFRITELPGIANDNLEIL